MSNQFRILVTCLVSLLLGACATQPAQKPMYYWGSYQEQVYGQLNGKTAPEEQIATLLTALSERTEPIVFTYPNVDPGSSPIGEALERFAEKNPRCRVFQNLGVQRYFSLMNIAAAMVGNSSSGLVEAGSFKLPVLNIGTRQDGRIRGPHVLDAACEPESIRQGLTRVLDPAFREGLRDMHNPYGAGHAAEIITERLKTIRLDAHLLQKRFFDLPEPSRGSS